MDYIKIEGVRPYDGRYEFDLGIRPLTTREWGWIKRLSDYMPLTVEKGYDGADPELFACFAVIALYRAGKVEARDVPETFERIADAPFGSTITIEAEGAEEERPEPNPSPPNSPASEPISGTDGRPNSESWDGMRAGTGTPDLATSVFPPATWGS